MTTFRPGDPVVYQPLHGRCEDGVVTSVGSTYVFVRFTGMHPDARGKACAPEQLRRAR